MLADDEVRDSIFHFWDKYLPINFRQKELDPEIDAEDPFFADAFGAQLWLCAISETFNTIH